MDSGAHKTYEQLPFSFHLSYNEDGEPKVVSSSDIEHVNKQLRDLSTHSGFLTTNKRLHGAYRQTFMGINQILNGDSDGIKAGIDRQRKYTQVLNEKGLYPVDWLSHGTEMYLFALMRRNRDTGQLEYKGLAIFVANDKEGRGKDLLVSLEREPTSGYSSEHEREFRNSPTVHGTWPRVGDATQDPQQS